MKKNLLKKLTALPLALLLLTAAVPANANEYTQNAAETVVTEKPAEPMPNPYPYFTGAVQLQGLFDANDDTTYGGAYVFFSPGARSYWHTHPGGQRLIIVKGVCWTGTEDGGKTVAKAGDTVWCPPGVKHWHGAAPDCEMVHLALTEVRNGQNVTWMEEVTDEQYYAD